MGKQQPTAKEIVQGWLESNGFDGLWTDECGCTKDDLMPCGVFGQNCHPGYRTKCPSTCGDHDFHIGPRKPHNHRPSTAREEEIPHDR